MKRGPVDEGARHLEVEGCQGESGKAGIMIAFVDVTPVTVVAVVGGSGYGNIYYLNGSFFDREVKLRMWRESSKNNWSEMLTSR